jgi:hypothetical protein
VTPRDLATSFEHLFHVAEARNWAGIQKHGLLSTTAILDLYGVAEPLRTKLEGSRRSTTTVVPHEVYGEAVIRDQRPMSVRKLESCLDAMSVEEWLRLLNRRVFFWLSTRRLETFLAAYSDHDNVVLTVSTAGLVTRHAEAVHLSWINTGATLRRPARRGHHTFLPLSDDDANPTGAPVEVAVDYAIPDIMEILVKAETRDRHGATKTLWQRKPA